MTRFLFLLCLFVGLNASAQVRSTVANEKNEHWWGGYTALGSQMPFVDSTRWFDLRTQNFNNQGAPFFVSSTGRTIWLAEPGRWRYTAKGVEFDLPTQKVEAVKSGKNLREAYIRAADAHFKPSGVIPPVDFFEKAQWNTWIELLYDQTQAQIMDYAKSILANGFEPGILMVDDNWQRYYGSYDFKAERFPDAKGMVDSLHAMGFKVMLWVCPFVSPDSPEFRDLQKRGLLAKNADGSTRVIPWWNGYSVAYDLLNPEAMHYVESQLRGTMERYGVDGFKLDAGDVNFYDAKESNAQCAAWQALALKFPYNELRASWAGGGQAHVQRLGDKNYSWKALASLIPDMAAAGLLGYPYTCPDMIGGGQYSSFEGKDRSQLDQALIVRWAQASALMPMMQFSVAPWKVLDAQNLKVVREAAALHKKMAPYILAVAHEAAKTGEPMVRTMEYQYPSRGFWDCKDQFMLGSKYMVAPILTKENKRIVRLPPGTWTDDKGKRYRGPQVIEILAPLDRLPYFELK